MVKFFSKFSFAWVLALLVPLIWAGVALAASYTLSGQVTDQSSAAVANALVEVINPASGTTVYSTTTNAGGSYALTVDAGTYDVKVTPPGGSGFGESTVLAQNITADTTLDVVLVPAGNITLTGRVLDGEGVGLGNERVQATPAGGGTTLYSTTDISGTYTFAMAPGNYNLIVESNGYNPPTFLAPQNYYFYSTSSLAFTQSTVLDLPLPAKRVDVHVQDPAGNAVPNVDLTTSQPYNSFNVASFQAYGYSGYFSGPGPEETSTDAAGNATLWLFPTTSNQLYTISAFPSSSSPYADFNIQNVSVLADKSINVILQFQHAQPVTAIDLNPPAGWRRSLHRAGDGRADRHRGQRLHH
ncbi:MAG: hypothetical protein Kow0031_37870 [Anaerolineae bacterium]